MATKDLTFRLLGEDSTATLALRRLSDEAGRTSKHFEGAFKLAGAAIGGAALAGVAAIGAIVKTGIGEAMDASAGMAQLQAGIKSTGGAAGVTVGHMENLASSIQGMSGQTDDSIVKAEQLLLTFTNIRNKGPNKIFDQATQAAADMAAKMGGDASTNAIRLGKALNDPVKGISALSKVGVSFTEAQKKQVAAMVKSGDTMGAQKLILRELNREFGGAAKAAGNSLPGQLQRAQRAFEDMSQTVVETILPVITPAIGQITAALKRATPFLQTMARTVATTLKNAFTTLAPTIGRIGAVLATQVLPAIAAFGGWMAKNRGLIMGVAQVVVLAVAGFKAYVIVMQAIKLATAAWAVVQAVLNGAMMLNPVGLIVAAIIALIAVVILLVTHWKQVCAFLQNVWGAVCKWFQDTLNSIAAIWNAIWAAVAAAVRAYLTHVHDTITGIITAIRNFFAGAGGWLLDAGRNIINGLVNGIKGMIGAVTSTVSNIAAGVVGTFKNILGIHSPSRVFHAFGTNIGEGLKGGLLGSVGQIKSASKSLSDAVISQFKSGAIGKGAEEAALSTISRMSSRLQALSKQRAAALANVASLKTDRSNMIGTVRSANVDAGNVTSFGSSGDMIQGLQSLVANTRRFKTDLQRLVTMGIDRTTFDQLVNAGVTGGGLTAADELIANPMDFRQVMSLQRQLGSASSSLANFAGGHDYNSRIALQAGRAKVYGWEMQKTAANGLNTTARETHVHIHLTGHYAGTKDDLAKSVTTAIRDAVRRGQLPKNVLTAL